MDIIAEILNAEKMAEEKLREAEEKSADLLKQCEQEGVKLKEESAENIKEYECLKNNKANEEILSAESEINAEEQKKIAELDKIYNGNHEKWENEITDRILSM